MGIEVGNCTVGNVGKNATGTNVGCCVGAGVLGTGFVGVTTGDLVGLCVVGVRVTSCIDIVAGE